MITVDTLQASVWHFIQRGFLSQMVFNFELGWLAKLCNQWFNKDWMVLLPHPEIISCGIFPEWLFVHCARVLTVVKDHHQFCFSICRVWPEILKRLSATTSPVSWLKNRHWQSLCQKDQVYNNQGFFFILASIHILWCHGNLPIEANSMYNVQLIIFVLEFL